MPHIGISTSIWSPFPLWYSPMRSAMLACSTGSYIHLHRSLSNRIAYYPLAHLFSSHRPLLPSSFLLSLLLTCSRFSLPEDRPGAARSSHSFTFICSTFPRFYLDYPQTSYPYPSPEGEIHQTPHFVWSTSIDSGSIPEQYPETISTTSVSMRHVPIVQDWLIEPPIRHCSCTTSAM
jgi:hypothetical protein